jgi:hypothetical protein
MRSLVRTIVGLLLAVAPITFSAASVAHADTRLNETCVIQSTNIAFTGVLTTIYNGPYTRASTATCTDIVVTSPTPGVQVPSRTTAGTAAGHASGSCAAAVLNGGGDWRNGAGVLIGGSVIVAGSAFPLTGDIAFTEVDALVPSGIPCLTETSASGLGVNDTVL